MGVAGRLRTLLVPVSWVYGGIVTVRNFCYDSGVFRIRKIHTPVISVGNITTGGTGKTPLVEHLAARLIGMGLRPAFLSRGYGRKSRGTLVVSDGRTVAVTPAEAGDESVQVARKFPGCPVVVDERRVRGALLLESGFHPDVILLDDGFQHRALHRDLDILVLDDGRDATAMRLLPAGDRREHLGAVRRAGLVIVNRRGEHPVVPPGAGTGHAVMSHRLKRFVDPSTGLEVPGEAVRKSECIAFCGIGNPASFRRTLLANGITPAEFIPFPDHHRFTADDLALIDESSDVNGARYILTTEKDAIRLDAGSASPTRIPSGLLVAEIETVIEEGDGLIARAVTAATGRGG